MIINSMRAVSQLIASLVLAGGFGMNSAHASYKDFDVLARMLHFIDGVPQGERSVGVVVDPSVPGSLLAAEELQDALDGGKSYKNHTLVARIISPSEIGSVDFVFVPEGMASYHKSVSVEAERTGKLTITNDPLCVERQQCVVSVRRRGRTEILWSRGAAERLSFGLGATLKALVDERP